VFKNIWSSLATVDGQLVMDGSEALLSDKQKTRKRRRDDLPTPLTLVSVDLIQDLVSEFSNTRIMHGFRPLARLFLSGFDFAPGRVINPPGGPGGVL